MILVVSLLLIYSKLFHPIALKYKNVFCVSCSASIFLQGLYRHVRGKFKDFSRTSKDYPTVFKD